MKRIFQNFSLFFIFFIILMFKDSVYSLIKDNTLEIQNTISETKKDYYEEEYQKLLMANNINLPNNYNYVLSKVVFRDVYDFYDELTILKGSEDKINKGDAVLNEDGLIGTVKKTDKNSSVVSLITNKNIEISVVVNNVYGILKFIDNRLIITSVNNYEDIEIGDIVYTSGIGYLPKGIKIGEITKVMHDTYGIEKKLTVTPYVDFDDINYVAILNEEV